MVKSEAGGYAVTSASSEADGYAVTRDGWDG